MGSGSGSASIEEAPAVDGAVTSPGTAANLLSYFPVGHVVTALIRYGACQTQCLEGSARVSLTIPTGTPQLNPAWQKFIPQYFTLPTRITGLSVRAVRNAGILEIWLAPLRAVPPATGPLTFFPLDPAVLDTCVVTQPEVRNGQTWSL